MDILLNRKGLGMKEFKGYDFDDREMRPRMKYVIIRYGDLDINGAYAFRSKKDLREHLISPIMEVQAIFEINDVTDEYL